MVYSYKYLPGSIVGFKRRDGNITRGVVVADDHPDVDQDDCECESDMNGDVDCQCEVGIYALWSDDNCVSGAETHRVVLLRGPMPKRPLPKWF